MQKPKHIGKIVKEFSNTTPQQNTQIICKLCLLLLEIDHIDPELNAWLQSQYSINEKLMEA